MLRLCGSRKTLCDGFSRRDLLQIGGLGMFGLSLSDALRLQALGTEAAPAPSFGKAKACILLFPFGSPPQHETFDPKPAAPAEIQGELKAISTSVPGVPCSRPPRHGNRFDTEASDTTRQTGTGIAITVLCTWFMHSGCLG